MGLHFCCHQQPKGWHLRKNAAHLVSRCAELHTCGVNCCLQLLLRRPRAEMEPIQEVSEWPARSPRRPRQCAALPPRRLPPAAPGTVTGTPRPGPAAGCALCLLPLLPAVPRLPLHLHDKFSIITFPATRNYSLLLGSPQLGPAADLARNPLLLHPGALPPPPRLGCPSAVCYRALWHGPAVCPDARCTTLRRHCLPTCRLDLTTRIQQSK